MRTKKNFDKQNEYNREHYDRFSLMLPKEAKAELQAIAKAKGLSLNALINEAIKTYISTDNSTKE